MLVDHFVPKKLSFFLKFCCKFLTLLHFLKVLSTKNTENAYFDQRLECAAPKRKSKYTTNLAGLPDTPRINILSHAHKITSRRRFLAETSKSQKSMCFQEQVLFMIQEQQHEQF